MMFERKGILSKTPKMDTQLTILEAAWYNRLKQCNIILPSLSTKMYQSDY